VEGKTRFSRRIKRKKKEKRKDVGDSSEVRRIQILHWKKEEDETNIMMRQNQLFDKRQQLFMFFIFF
jgi:hypothetical protein